MFLSPIHFQFAAILWLSLAVGNLLSAADPISLVDLKCDNRTTPLAVDCAQPKLSWRLVGQRTGLAQTAFQVQAASDVIGFAKSDRWDSGWVKSSHSTNIRYLGRQPQSTERIYWRVRIKDERGTVLGWSDPTWFEAGLLEDADWHDAKWIGSTRMDKPYYAPDDVMGEWIAAAKPVKARVVVYTTSFELPNKPVVFAGTWWNSITDTFSKVEVNNRGVARTNGPDALKQIDFSFYLKPGRNVVRLIVNGPNAKAPVCMGMRIVFADGTERIVGSSGHWNTLQGKEKSAVRVIRKYGPENEGKAQIYGQEPLAPAWFKKDVEVTRAIESARLYLCGLGYSEPYLNGEKVGDHVLDPGQTDYGQFAHYQTFDVSQQLKPGGNSLAILLGDGWYHLDRSFCHAHGRNGKPGLRTMLKIRYQDGTSKIVTTDPSWHWKESGVTSSNLYLGDHIDYRKAHDEWKTVDVPEDWEEVRVVQPLSPRLIAQDFPPIRQVRKIAPVRTWAVGEKTWIVDLGENISGWIAMDIDEPSGTVIRIRCTESVDEDSKQLKNVPGSFWDCHAAPQHHQIIADGKPRRWHPLFSYHGFRYAEIHGLSQAPKPGQIEGIVVHTDTPVVATFESSDPMLNRIFQMGIRTHLNNMHSILEDCPHREKCLWGGDLHASWATGYYALESASFYRQQIRLYFTPPVSPQGIPGLIGVGKRLPNNMSAFVWSVSPIFLAWRNYAMHNDLQPFEDHYEEMLGFLRFFEKDAPNLIPKQIAHGDHAAPSEIRRAPENKSLISTMHFFAAATRFADMAEGLGKMDDARWAQHLADRIHKTILSEFYDSKNQTFGNGTHDSLALAFEIVPPDQVVGVADSLARVYQENGQKFDGGFMSYHIYPQLTKHGNVDLALSMLLNPDYPGIAASIRDHDATTIFERFWHDSTKQDRVSWNHHAMNHPSAWMLNDIAGIRVHPDEPGMRCLLLAPHFPKNLDSVRCSLKTSYGLVKSEWSQHDGQVTWEIQIPPNSTAEGRLPAGIRNLRVEGQESPANAQSFPLTAGKYQLQWQ